MSDETFDTEAVMRDILEVLKKHEIPAQTVEVNLSLFNDDFDKVFPHLLTYKAGIFYRENLIDDIATLVRAKRRYSFDDFVTLIESKILPLVTISYEQLKDYYPQFTFKLYTSRNDGSYFKIGYTHAYAIVLEGRLSEAQHENFNVIHLGIFMKQIGLTDQPKFSVSVNWLVNEEGEGDWGHHRVSTGIGNGMEVQPHLIDLLEKQIQSLVLTLRDQLLNPPYERY